MIAALKTLEYLSFDFARQGLVTALAVATASAALSYFVVIRRLSFVAQGVSHAAFGGLGIAAILGLSALAGDAVVFAFCVASALAIGVLAASRTTREDAAIGIVLVAAMAAGILLLSLRQSLLRFDWYRDWLGPAAGPVSWEAVLFGSIQTAGPAGVVASVAAAAVVVGLLAWHRRALIFYTFDELAAEAAGIPTARMRALLMVLLALVIVVGMRLVGVVLISALLVLPGATALHLTRRLAPAFALSWAAAVMGVLGGLVFSFEFDALRLPSGPCIVLVLVLEFALAALASRTRRHA